MSVERSTRAARRSFDLSFLTIMVFALAGCGGGTSPSSPAPATTSNAVTVPSASPTAGPTLTASPAPASAAPPSAAPASQAADAHCAITPGATAAATVQWNMQVEGRNPTIKAGEAVAFVTQGSVGPTVTEGTNGTPVAHPCVDVVLAANRPVVLTFFKPGVYNLFCRRRPDTMYTVVNVQ